MAGILGVKKVTGTLVTFRVFKTSQKKPRIRRNFETLFMMKMRKRFGLVVFQSFGGANMAFGSIIFELWTTKKIPRNLRKNKLKKKQHNIT